MSEPGPGVRLRTSAFAEDDLMPQRLSRQGGNASPPLEWSGVPQGTAELVLLCEDPDAGSEPFVHWLVTGIDPKSAGVAEGATPPGGHEWPNGFGEVGYGGPQPPKGDEPHRYFFQLWAVREPIRLPERPAASDVHEAVEKSALAHAVTYGLFGR